MTAGIVVARRILHQARAVVNGSTDQGQQPLTRPCAALVVGFPLASTTTK